MLEKKPTISKYILEGFYKDTIPGTKNIIMVLNTNYWYNSNKEVDGTGDPGQQFHWMKVSLESARQNSQKVSSA